MKVRKNVLFSIVLMLVLGATQFATPSAVFAAGPVGDGNPASCTDAALDSALSGGGTVTFNCGASPKTIILLSTKSITSSTQINGGGLITLSGNDVRRLFTVSTGATLTLSNITISDGYNVGDGGAIYLNSGSTATVTNSTFTGNNTLDGYGGAIYVNAATLNITNSTFSSNSADVTSIGSLSLGGGAIQNNDGTVTITGSTFNGNTVVSPSGDGGAIYNGDFDGGVAIPDGITDTLIVSNSTFYNNTLVGDTDGSSGGAIRSNSDTTLIHNTFSNNDGGVSQAFGGESGAVTFTRGNVTLRNNIFANSSGTYDCAKRNEVVSLTESGNIVETHFNCGTPISTADPNLGVLQDNGGPTWTIDFTDVTAATDAVACAGGLTADQRGVVRPTGSSCDVGSLEVDRFQPTVTINKAGGQSDPTNASPVNFTIVFSEPVVGFTTGDVNLSASTVGGTLLGTVSGGPTTFNVAVTGMTTPGDITASIDAGAATDIALNANVASTSSDNTVAYDGTGPVVTIEKAAAQDDPTNNATINFTVVFDESVTGFTASDVTIGGTANPTTKNVTGSGTTYNVAVGGFGNDGTVTAVVNAGAVSDTLGNPSTASTTASVTYDTVGPTVTINQADGQSDPAGSSDAAIDFTVVFSEAVANFATGDVTVSGTAGATTGTVTEIAPNNGTTYNVAVTNATQSGTVIANIAAGVANDAAGNSSAAATFSDNQVTFDSDRPSVTIDEAAGQDDPTGLSPANFAVVFSKPVTGFETGDVTVTGTAGVAMIGIVTEVGSMDGTTYNVAVTGMTNNGTAVVSFLAGAAEDSASNPSLTPTIIDNSVTFNFLKPGVPALTAPLSGSTVTGLQPLLDWNASSPVAQFYQIQISTVSTFTSIVTDQSNITATQFTPASDLVPGLTYYWRVRGHNSIGMISNWSTVRNFKTPLGTPVANAPVNDIVLATDRPTFEWTAVPGATSYSIQISTVNTFASITSSINALTSPYTWHVDLPQNTPLFWRVQARTATVVSSWSAVKSFKTGNPPTVPVLASPINNILIKDYTPLLNWNDSTVPAGVTFRYYEIQVDDSANFAAPLALQGTTTLNSITSSQYVDEGTPLNPGTLYYWRVRSVSSYLGVDQFSAWSTAATFRTVYDKPVLVTPANAAALATLRPSFDWQDIAGATGYQLAISRFNTMATPLVNVTLGATSSYAAVVDLPVNTTLYWYVRATGPFGPGLWSDIRSFKTGNPPTTPILVAPVSNVLLTDLTPNFNWNDSTVTGGATFSYYEIEVDDNSNFADPLALEGSTTAGVITLSQYNDELTPLNAGVTYYWRVRAVSSYLGVDQVGAWSKVGIFRTAYDKPVLTSPAQAETLGTLRPSFDWQDVFGATGYQISISRFSTMTSPLLNATMGTTSSYTAATDLPVNTTLYWYVRATGTYGPSLWSNIQSFKTGNPPSIPLLVAPAGNALNTNYLPLFDWSNSTVPAGTFKYYEIEVDDNSNFQSTAFTRTTTLNAVTASQYQTQAGTDILNPNTKYYWRVRAVSTISGVDHFSNWSTVRYFRTALTPPASLTVIPNATKPSKPTFDWDNVTGAASYTIQVSLNANFGSPLVNATVSGSSYVPGINLPVNTLLYWRVRANGTNTSAWSTSTYTIIP